MRRHLAAVFALLTALAPLAGEMLRAEIIISEIMYNPGGADFDANAAPPFNREWIELYNTGSDWVNMEGWQIGDAQDNTWAAPFPSRTVLGPGQALVVTGDALAFDTTWGGGLNRIEVANFPAFANDPSPTNEAVAIRNRLGAVLDTVNYDDAFGWPRANGSHGQSIFALPSGLTAASNDTGTNWRPSSFGAYGARYVSRQEQNHGSPGLVDTESQPPFAPSPDAAWSMVVLPDTQNYAKSSLNREIFTQMTEWIRDHKEEYKIQLALQEGDIVNNNNNVPTNGDLPSSQQWQNAQTSMHVLNGHLPYIMAAGNHDYGTTNAQNRQTFFNDYFKSADNSLVDPAQGGILKGTMNPGELQNAYYEFAAPDGRKMLVLALEWEPRPATVAWANQIAGRPEYADHTAVLLTHAYLLGNSSRYSGSRVEADADGEELWQNLVSRHGNFELTFNGHFGGDGSGYATGRGSGTVVHQMFFNTQFETHGGGGWLRLVEFLKDGKTVRVRTYSPFYDMVRPHPQFEFEFAISPLPLPPPLAGDYNGDGIVSAADYLVWRRTNGSTLELSADGDGNGIVDHGDYEIWRSNFGAALPGLGQTAVPEPGSIASILTAGCLGAGIRRRFGASASRTGWADR
jgi:hypothetical protein